MNPLASLTQHDESKGEFTSTRGPPNYGITISYSNPTYACANYIY